ncbi:MAG: response regulator transcription factor [Prolixibacteraceae bacterium]
MKRLTEKELITANKTNLHLIESNVLNKKASLKELAEMIPGIVHFNNLENFGMQYVNSFGEEKFETSLEEIIRQGDSFVQKFFEPGTLEIFSEPLVQMVKENDDTRIISFFQKVKLNKHVNYDWLFTTSKILKGRPEFISISQVLSEVDSSTRAISRLLDDNLYLRKNMQRFGSLTKREKQVLKLVASGYSTKQIAEQLYLSPHTVSTHRKNISQKLDFKSPIDWERFAIAFDL